MDLARGQRCVGRHVDGGGSQDAHVGDQPFDAVLGQHTDAVARLHARGHKGSGAGFRLLVVIAPAQIAVEAVALAAHGGTRSQAFGLLTKQLGQVALVHESAGRNRVLGRQITTAHCTMTSRRKPRSAELSRETGMRNEAHSSPQGTDSFLPVLLALFVGGIILVFLILVSGGIFFYVVAAAFAIGAVGYCHYLLWGHGDSPSAPADVAEGELPAHRESNNGTSETPAHHP